MAFPQGIVAFNQGFGVIGELYDDSPKRVQSFILTSNAIPNIIGYAYTFISGLQGVVTAGNVGGTNVFAGYLVNPKAYASPGPVGGTPLQPTLTVPNYFTGEFLNMGLIIVALPAAANVGDLVVFSNTTGALATIAPGASIPSGFSNGYALVEPYPTASAGLSVIRVTTVP